MTPEQWAEVTRLFDHARAVPPSQRDAWLASACPDDAAVRTEVLSLLAVDTDDGFLESGAAAQPADLLDHAGGPDLVPGTTVGVYRIDRLLARGGMGVVYVATDTRLQRQVTVKVLPAAMARHPQARARLEREARTAALLRHPHIVSVHALESFGPTLALVSEYVEGPTLAEVLTRDGPLPPVRWRALAADLAAALAAAHAAHVVHRDVKPANIVLGRDGLRLVDFGIAHGVAADGATRLTLAGQFTGTPLAQAPEQLDGGDATALSDQFAYGLVLYEAASGRLPYGEGPVASVWARMLRDQAAPLRAPQLTAVEIAIVHRCLSRDPARRFAAMTDVIDALRGPDPRMPPTVAVTTWGGVHHLATTALYVGMLWPAWLSCQAVSGPRRATAHLMLVGLAAVASSLRLHLWFSQRHYPPPVAESRRRLWPVVLAIDVAYAGLVCLLGWWAADTRLVAATVAVGLGVCLLMASIVIEPATRRAE